MGVSEDPRRAGRPGSEGSGVDSVGDSEEGRDQPRAAPMRATWPQFLRSQAEAILACDFFSADLLDGTRAYVLAVIEHATRRIRILGVTQHPTGAWTTQQARNLLMDLGEQTHRVKFMIRDRGSNFHTRLFNTPLARSPVVRGCRRGAPSATGWTGRGPGRSGQVPVVQPGREACAVPRQRPPSTQFGEALPQDAGGTHSRVSPLGPGSGAPHSGLPH